MRRDMEVVRKLLRAIQDKADLDEAEITIEGVDQLTTARHLELLLQAGFIDGYASDHLGEPVPAIYVRDLSWEGHEFAGALLADESTWQKVKTAIGAEGLAKLPLKLVQELTTKALMAYATKKLGL